MSRADKVRRAITELRSPISSDIAFTSLLHGSGYDGGAPVL
ncbi:hypothetical protein SynA1560_01124 [Synechococcus sp. A15-60]|nr:hypothetical protein SynA1560_01124 [Synechococcus sp. A15-60]